MCGLRDGSHFKGPHDLFFFKAERGLLFKFEVHIQRKIEYKTSRKAQQSPKHLGWSWGLHILVGEISAICDSRGSLRPQQFRCMVRDRGQGSGTLTAAKAAANGPALCPLVPSGHRGADRALCIWEGGRWESVETEAASLDMLPPPPGVWSIE